MKRVKENLFYYYLLFLVIIFPLIPKSFNIIFGIFPVRLALLSGLFVIYFYEKYIKHVQMKNCNKILLFLLILFCISLLPGVLITSNKLLFFYSLYKMISLVLLIITITTYNFKDKQVKSIVNAFIYISLITSIVGIIDYIFNINLNINGITKYPGAIGRTSSTFFNPIYLAIYLFIINILIVLKIKPNKKNLKFFIIYLINTICILLTYTRMVAVLLVVNILIITVFSIFEKKKSNFAKNVMLTFVTLVLIIMIPGAKYLYSSTLVTIMPENFSKAVLKIANKYFFMDFDLKLYGIGLSGNDNKTSAPKPNNNGYKPSTPDTKIDDNDKKSDDVDLIDASAESRKEFKLIAEKVIGDNKIFGVGLGNYENYVLSHQNQYVYNRFGYPHNFILHLEAETGIITTLIFLIIYIGTLIYCITAFILNKEKIFLIISVILINLFILMFFESILFDTQIAPLLLILILVLLKERKNKDVLFISSVGGHLTQLLELKLIFKKFDYILITEKNDVTKSLEKKYKIEFLPYGSRNQKIKYLGILIVNCIKSLLYIIKYNPKVIVTTGANTAATTCVLAKLFGKKVIYIESFAKNSSQTITGKWIYKLNAYSKFVVQWPNMLKFYPKAEYWGSIY